MPSGGAVVGMWSEARRQEKAIRGAMVDYRKRAERRSQYYEKIKQDPAQFLRVHGRKIKMKLDSSEAEKAEGSAVMQPWQGDETVIIDRFDARTFLDYLPEPTVYETSSDSGESSGSERSDSGRTRTEEKKTGKRRSNCDYERYKTLIQNDYLCIDEAACLKQIYQEEEHGGVVGLSSSTAAGAPPNGSAPLHALDKSSKSSTSTTASSTTSTAKAAIGYNYEKNAPIILGKHSFISNQGDISDESSDSGDESFDEIDLEVTLDIDKLDVEQKKLLITHSLAYGLKNEMFLKYLTKDKEDQENLRLAKMLEDEKALYSGRKGRYKRREFHEEKMQLQRKLNPNLELSYATKRETDAKKAIEDRRSRSRKDSSTSTGSSVADEAPKFITSFDANEDESSVKKTKKSYSRKRSSRRSRSRDDRSRSKRRRSRSGSRKHMKRRRSSASRSRSRGRPSPKRKTSRPRSRSRSPHRSRKDRSGPRKSNERSKYGTRRSRSRSGRRSRSRSRLVKRSRSRSRMSQSEAKHRSRAEKKKSPRELIRKPGSLLNRNLGVMKRSRSSSDSSLEKLHRPQLKLEPLPSDNTVTQGISNPQQINSAAVPDNNVVKRYRRKSLSSSSGLEDDSPPRNTPFPPRYANTSHSPGIFKLEKPQDFYEKPKVNTPISATKKPGNAKSATERMKRLMEKQLNKQIKVDKQNRALKEEKKMQEQIEWEEHQRSMSDKWAHKSKHRNGSASDSDSDNGRSSRNYLKYSAVSPKARRRESSDASN